MKRLTWILNCANVSGFLFQAFNDLKTNKFRIFVRVRAVREYFEVWWSPEQASIFEPHPEIPRGLFDVSWWNWRDVGFGTKTVRAYGYPRDENVYTLVEEPIEHCYYLGQYPLMWDTWWHSITSPADSTVSWRFPPTMGEGGLFPVGWKYTDPIPPGVIDTTGAGFPRGWKPGDRNPPNINYDQNYYFKRHDSLPGERFVPFYGPIVPPGWEPTILGYMPMDSTADIEKQIEQLERGIIADKILAETEKGKDFKIWMREQRHLTPEEIIDIKSTISALKTRKDLEKYGPKTEGGMLVSTWVQENIMVTEEDLLFFWGDHDYHTYILTKEWARVLVDKYKNFLAQNYPIK